MIWFKWDNVKSNIFCEGVVKIDNSNLSNNKHLIQDSIDLFNSYVEWEGMYNLEEASRRIQQDNETCFILTFNDKVLGHTWFGDMWWYNIFIDPNRPQGITLKFCLHCFNNIDQDSFYGWTDYWNIKATKLFIKTGAKILHPLYRL